MMYKELIKRLRDLPHLLFVQLGEHEELVYQAADAIESTSKAYQMMVEAYESEVTKHCWIPVTKRLPEENGRYLTVVKRTIDREYAAEFGDNSIEVRITRFHDKWRVPYHCPEWINDVITDVVTHWMPLPEVPEGYET